MVQEVSYSSFFYSDSWRRVGWRALGEVWSDAECESAETKLPNIMQIHLVILDSL